MPLCPLGPFANQRLQWAKGGREREQRWARRRNRKPGFSIPLLGQWPKKIIKPRDRFSSLARGFCFRPHCRPDLPAGNQFLPTGDQKLTLARPQCLRRRLMAGEQRRPRPKVGERASLRRQDRPKKPIARAGAW